LLDPWQVMKNVLLAWSDQYYAPMPGQGQSKFDMPASTFCSSRAELGKRYEYLTPPNVIHAPHSGALALLVRPNENSQPIHVFFFVEPPAAYDVALCYQGGANCPQFRLALEPRAQVDSSHDSPPRGPWHTRLRRQP
jgi:hypothetical protein